MNIGLKKKKESELEKENIYFLSNDFQGDFRQD